ncbi:hypothetical protein DVH26_09675 [Paenibacillus sp. H1-7]|uniref:adenosylcobinamide amidohydrolase n=1 Tax=Paenibacillus sp. H1-7 TaxID=2282849 RepID=UPI001EF8FEC2|nr:adenosylcobinamide amidohydrolase [Paenibacillus sp. H1-7]ULL14697.1 hypothetical protein DVH26_09675 [Paenibacillus sp. H1-7]
MTLAHSDAIQASLIPGIRLLDFEDGVNSFYIIESERGLKTLNSSMWGEGFGRHYRLMNRQVDRSYSCDDPMAEMNDFMRLKGLKAEGTAALLTAARVKDRGYTELSLHTGLKVCTWATAGLSNRARAGQEQRPEELFPGTINIITVIDGQLTDAAMVNAVITATEAKTAALQDAGIRMEDIDKHATGTTTDAVIIASTQEGPPFRYAGTATQLGYFVGRTVYESVKSSIVRYEQWVLSSNQ